VVPDQILIAADHQVGTPVAVDVADVDAFGDLAERARVNVVSHERERRRTNDRRGGGSLLDDHCRWRDGFGGRREQLRGLVARGQRRLCEHALVALARA